MEFSYKTFEDEFASSMAELEQAFRKRDYLKTIGYLRFLIKSYYVINYKLTDDRLEEITKGISFDLLGETRISKSKAETVAVYDSIGLSDRGVSDIYVSALAKLGYKVTWIMHCNARGLEMIQKQYAGNKNVSFRIIPQSPVLERMRYLQTIILETSPRHLFIHSRAWDVCGIGSISTVTGDVTRYFINIVGHAFWVGKCAFDYDLAGKAYVDANYRHIAPEKILTMFSYPRSRTEYPFEGMPFDVEKYKYVFSGGSAYKILGDPAYQEIVEYIMTQYPDLKFVYADDGTNQVLDYLEETYPGQFFHINNRNDLDAILQRAKLYLATYPVNGGLMIQYPIVNGCPQLCLCQEKGSYFDPTTFLMHPEKVDFVFYTKKDLLLELDRLLQDQQYYDEKKASLQNQDFVIDEVSFRSELQKRMMEGREKLPKNWTPVKMENFMKAYKNNATYDQFCHLIYGSHNEWLQKKYPDIMKRMEGTVESIDMKWKELLKK